ncbi:RibD family protein [Xanthobacter autotrophicus]|uniref:RibD family protein n=1 Tax=Xanthobacter autotrophicus TaxID=280 RepID=UPI00372AA249
MAFLLHMLHLYGGREPMDDTTRRRSPHHATTVPEVAIRHCLHKGERPFVVAQLGQSLDGRIATPSGDSKYINGPHALDHLHALRAGVDAVMVGVGTVIADDPMLTVRRVAGQSPARVVIDPSGRADPSARCFTADGARRIVLRRAGIAAPVAEGVEVIALEEAGAFAPAAMLDALAARGLTRILVEGGAHTLSAFLEAGCLDALHVFVSPVILGAGRIGLTRKACDTLADALRPAARAHVFPDGDVLFACDLARGAGTVGDLDRPQQAGREGQAHDNRTHDDRAQDDRTLDDQAGDIRSGDGRSRRTRRLRAAG